MVKLVVHLLTGTGYGYFGDELYNLAATKHLDFGYVDMPPLVPLLMALSNRVFGVSLFALHILPAVAGAVMVYFAGLLAHELGGGRFAQGLTAVTNTDIMEGNKYSISYEQYVPVYICRKPKIRLKKAWKRLEAYY